MPAFGTVTTGQLKVGARIKINWANATFIAKFAQFRPRACYWNGTVSISQCSTNSNSNWWTSPMYNKLNNTQMGQLKWVRDNYMISDYCTDTKRFNGQMPPECFLDETCWHGGCYILEIIAQPLYNKFFIGCVSVMLILFEFES